MVDMTLKEYEIKGKLQPEGNGRSDEENEILRLATEIVRQLTKLDQAKAIEQHSQAVHDLNLAFGMTNLDESYFHSRNAVERYLTFEGANSFMPRGTNRVKRSKLRKEGKQKAKPDFEAQMKKRQQVADNKGRWWRQRKAYHQSMGGLAMFPQKDAAARGRYTRLQKHVAKTLKNNWTQFGFKNVRVLDLACGIFKRNSPTAEDFMRLLEINKIPIESYVGVDKDANRGRKHRGITYNKGDVVKFLQRKNIGNPNVIVALRILEHLPAEEYQKFTSLYWKKLPEKGILITDVQLLGKEFWSPKWSGLDRKSSVVSIVSQKIGGKPRIIFTGISPDASRRFGLTTKELMTEINKQYDPTNPVIKDLGK